jgi:dUTP pyrophosphatase
MKVKVKKLHENAVIPKYATVGSAGMDLVATSRTIDEYGNLVYGIGLAFEIPKGYVGLIFPRSSVSKHPLSMKNCVGVIDSDYRGEVTVKFGLFAQKFAEKSNGRIAGEFCSGGHIYDLGDRVAQIIIIPYPEIEFEEAEELSETERGSGGYGSTGK